KPEGCAAGQDGQGPALCRLELTHRGVTSKQCAALGDVECEVRLEAPGIKAHRNVVSEEVVAGKVEVDQARQLGATEKHIIGKEVGVDDAARQALRPARQQLFELAAYFIPKPRPHLVGAILEPLE